MTVPPDPNGTLLRPFDNPPDVAARPLADRLIGRARADLAVVALQRLLFEQQPGQISRGVIDKLEKDFGLEESDRDPLGESLFEKALEAFAADNVVSEEEHAYLLDLRRLLNVSEDVVLRCEERVLYPRFRRYIADVIADRMFSEVEKLAARTFAEQLRIPRDVQERLTREVVTGRIGDMLKAPFAAKRISAEVLEHVHRDRTSGFGNARFVRNLFERTISQHANRVAGMQRPSREDLRLISVADLPDQSAVM